MTLLQAGLGKRLAFLIFQNLLCDMCIVWKDLPSDILPAFVIIASCLEFWKDLGFHVKATTPVEKNRQG